MTTNMHPATLGPTANLVEKYRVALEKISDQMLLILLWFNVFEEIMRAYCAWRLSRKPEHLRERQSSGELFDLVIAPKEHPTLNKKMRLLLELRNLVAHKFHVDGYRAKLAEFIKAATGKEAPEEAQARQAAFIDAITNLALDVAQHLISLPVRDEEFPVPVWSFELQEAQRKPKK